MQEHHQYVEEADTYRIKVRLDDEGKLYIELYDLVDWVIYEKEYTEQNRDGQINKRLELFDIYSSLTDTQSPTDNSTTYNKDSKPIRQYIFGTVIKSCEIPCFKIERDGEITTYSTKIDKKTKKQSIIQSHLKLQKVRSMTDIQILKEKSMQENKVYLDKILEQLAKSNSQKQQLVKQFQQLKLQSSSMKTKITQISSQLEIKKQQISTTQQQLQTLNKEMKDLKQDHDKNKNQLQQTKQQLVNCQKQVQLSRDEVTVLREDISNLKEEFKIYNEMMQEKIYANKLEFIKIANQLTAEMAKLRDQFSTISEQNDHTVELEQIKQKLSYCSHIANINSPNKQMVGLEQSFHNKFRISENQLEYIGQNGTNTHFIFNSKIPTDQQYIFKIKIVKAPNKCIGIGVIDYDKQKYQRTSYNSNNAVLYYDNGSGYKYPSQIHEGNGYTEGTIIEVYVNLPNKTIKWVVGSKQIAAHTHEILLDESRIFMPYVEMRYVGAIMQWIQ